VDDDLGKSAVSAEYRQGFQFLMTEIGLGRVGLVISLDASRLARNNSDWYRLIELCSMWPRSWDWPRYAFRGGLRGAGASSTDSKIVANIERGFCPKNRSAAVVPSGRVRKKL
jgi:hypothetical protein